MHQMQSSCGNLLLFCIVWRWRSISSASCVHVLVQCDCTTVGTAELLRACPTYRTAPLSTHLLFESSSLPLLKVSGGDAMWGRDLHCELVLARAGGVGCVDSWKESSELRAQSSELRTEPLGLSSCCGACRTVVYSRYRGGAPGLHKRQVPFVDHRSHTRSHRLGVPGSEISAIENWGRGGLLVHWFTTSFKGAWG
jgi:hypothetical protein